MTRPSVADIEPVGPAGQRGRLARLARTNVVWTLGVLVGLAAVFAALRPEAFAGPFNIRTIFINAAIPVVLAVGMTFVIITGGIDLSVGSVLVFSGVVAAKVMAANGAADADWTVIALGSVAGVAAGTGWGLVNGLLVTKGRIPPLIATLGTLGMALGLAQVATDGSDLGAPRRLTDVVGNHLIARQLPVLALVAAAVAVVFGWLLAATRFGRHTYAVGSNPEAARRVGIRVDRHLIRVYALSGLLAGVAGVLNLAKFSSTTIASHTEDNLSAIAGAVLGGTSLFGGSGTIAGTVVGVLIPVVVNDGLIILGVQQFWLFVAVGAVLVVAVFFDQLRRRLRDRD
ncbi:ABC transporter permease [Planosporangium mesophilum]|uniref:Sugar ABC transporter permease n=1 Tax=Planosporangium mesophilum TaxID=689768 RepID=A0A8J3TEY8_9ACTN|nr:ABC transporter permease [Planosporangium mesophilum]NJC85984.1 ABC transporter permease [Planosporangium mesophilum]GII25915.1 sugar ABC transporter permease [Planosporangium mesophilum]